MDRHHCRQRRAGAELTLKYDCDIPGLEHNFIELRDDWSRGQANHTLAVWELLGTSRAVEAASWPSLREA